MLFGSELFEEYIGQLAMASMASLDIFTEGEQFDAKKVQEKMRVMIYCILYDSDLDFTKEFVFSFMLLASIHNLSWSFRNLSIGVVGKSGNIQILRD